MVEENAVSLEHAESASVRCIQLIESNTRLRKMIECDLQYQFQNLGVIILAAYLGNKIENLKELYSPSCQEIREIIYRFYDQEIAGIQ